MTDRHKVTLYRVVHVHDYSDHGDRLTSEMNQWSSDREGHQKLLDGCRSADLQRELRDWMSKCERWDKAEAEHNALYEAGLRDKPFDDTHRPVGPVLKTELGKWATGYDIETRTLIIEDGVYILFGE